MQDKKNEVFLLKGLAIIFVIYAHCPVRIVTGKLDLCMDMIRADLSVIGVPLFFLISGYLFHTRDKITVFLRKKIKVIVPWLFWGTLVWGYEVARKGLDYANLGEWLIGIGTYLWYMRTIFLFWIVFYFVRHRAARTVCFLVSCGYILARNRNMFSIENIWKLGNRYSIIPDFFVAFLPFFLIGIFMAAKEEKIKVFWEKYKKIILAISVLVVISVLIYNEFVISYASKFFTVYSLGLCILCYWFITCLRRNTFANRRFKWIGEKSFFIYLTHMPIAGALSWLMSKWYVSRCLILVSPIVCVAIL